MARIYGAFRFFEPPLTVEFGPTLERTSLEMRSARRAGNCTTSSSSIMIDFCNDGVPDSL